MTPPRINCARGRTLRKTFVPRVGRTSDSTSSRCTPYRTQHSTHSVTPAPITHLPAASRLDKAQVEHTRVMMPEMGLMPGVLNTGEGDGAGTDSVARGRFRLWQRDQLGLEKGPA